MQHIESAEQQELMRQCSYVAYRGATLRDYVCSIPNSLPRGGRRAMLQVARLKREGLTPGMPDVLCFVPMGEYHGLWIEMKKPDGVPSDVSRQQFDIIKRLESLGYKCVVAYGWKNAWQFLNEYLGLVKIKVL